MAKLMAAQAGDPGIVQQRLSAQMKLTRTTADRTDIVTAGDVVVIHKPGLVMFDVSSPLPPTNVYKDGKIGLGFGTQLMITDKNQQQRRFVPDEKCWVTRIAVLNDSVLIDLYSDPYSDVRYYATLKIPYPNKKVVPPVDSLLATIAEVLTVDRQDQGGQQIAGPAAPETAPAQSLQPSEFTGDYLLKGKGNHLFLFPDGSCKGVGADGKPNYYAQFSVSGDTLTLDPWVQAAPGTLKIQGTSMFNGKGSEFVRVGDAPIPSVAPGQVFPGTTDAQRAAFPGEYLRQSDGVHITFFSDGSFKVVLPKGRVIPGQYSVDGNTEVATAPGALAGNRYTLMGDKLLSETGSDFYVRTGDVPAPAAGPAMAAAPSTPLQSIAPPPPPADAPPPTVSLGETKDQIIAGFGQPVKKVDLGAKQIYYYKDMKITFMNGKVSNVE